MEALEQQAYIFGTIFTLSNKLQVLGNEFDRDITIKQWLFLVGVSRFKQPPTISEVAGFIGYSRQNAKRLAASLQQAGYLRIEKDQKDARALRIVPTEACAEHFERRNQREIEFLQRVFTGFDHELTLGVYSGLVRLEHNVRAMLSESGLSGEIEE